MNDEMPSAEELRRRWEVAKARESGERAKRTEDAQFEKVGSLGSNPPSSSALWKNLAIAFVGVLVAGSVVYGGYFLYRKNQETQAANARTADERKVVETAIDSLNKLHAGTEVGVNKIEYSRMLIESKALVNKANAELPKGELSQALSSAIEGYSDASIVWDKGGTDKGLLACEDSSESPSKSTASNTIGGTFDRFVAQMCNPEITALAIKYKIEVV